LRRRGARDYLADKLARIAYPYFLWSILQVSVEAIFSSQTQKGAGLADLLAIPYRPWGQFWFIYALFLMHAAYALLDRLGRYSTPVVFLLGAGLFFFPIRADCAALAGFSAHFLFFASGACLGRYWLDKDPPDLPLWAVVLFFALLAAAGCLTFSFWITPTRLTNGSHPFIFLFLSILGIIACTSLARYLAGKSLLRPLQTFGRYSLPIYLAHMLAGAGARVILVSVFHLQNWILNLAISILVALAAPILIKKASERINFPYLFSLRRS
jgi:fucose 4-O-acetylase-like acetyltransferase